MERLRLAGLIAILFLAVTAFAVEPDWSAGAKIPRTGRSNPYEVAEPFLSERIEAGRLHAVSYPVEITGALIPADPLQNLLDRPPSDPLWSLLKEVLKLASPFQTTDEIYEWLGLHHYPEESARGLYQVPYPEGKRPSYRMGASFIHTPRGVGLTFSCATCHSSNLFGKPVLGLTNRFPRANRFFILGKQAVSAVPPAMFRIGTRATSGETQMYEDMRNNVQAVGVKAPVALGLDTSLSQTALSIARRAPDPYATKDPRFERNPRPDPLDSEAADSKPAPWWNLKYKTRWLLDGSVVSGNPIFTNLLWNEIGRGTDLVQLEHWLDQNSRVIEEITTAVFAVEPPRITDFFSAERISPSRARHGEALYIQNCAKCHGTYEKVWNQPGAEALAWAEQIKTSRVLYHEKTPVIDVGTDPKRAKGMESLARALNPLAISQKHGIWIEPQKGYIPPPLVGIWARWPYFHNNSAPTLCAVISQVEDRPVGYWSGPALDQERDYDWDCGGYPSVGNAPQEWKRSAEHFYDTRLPGMSNAGHAKWAFTEDEKRDLVEFLKTL